VLGDQHGAQQTRSPFCWSWEPSWEPSAVDMGPH
jgi:hypothetical protein